MICITSAQYSMRATVLSQGGFDTTPEAGFDDTPLTPNLAQDPNTGEILRVWSADTIPGGVVQQKVIKCKVRGIISKTTRGEGTSTKITAAGLIDDTDYVMMDFLPTVSLSKRDRITNIKNLRAW